MQSVPLSFHQKSQAGIRKHKWSLLMSFDKSFDPARTFFTLDSSTLDGTDVLAPVGNNEIQFWDFYAYTPYTDRVMSMEWERESAAPYSVQSSSASVTLNNFDNYFSSHTNSPINNYLVPNRPMKILSGYHGAPLLQQFVGLTKGNIELDQTERVAKLNALDYLSEIFTIPLSQSIAMSNVRTDEVLAAIFTQFGIEAYQYSLTRGRNIIPFLFIPNGADITEYIRKIMEAEGGQLWIDEQGIIRFDQRLTLPTGPVFTFNESNISALSSTGDQQIINRVKLKSNIREVQGVQPIHYGSGQLSNPVLSSQVVVPASGTVTYNISLSDPLEGYSEPTLGEIAGDSWFTVVTSTGDTISTDVSVTASTLTTNQLSLVFTNTNVIDAYIQSIQVYGEPAKIVDTLDYEAFDQESIDAYGDHLLSIDNDMFGSESNCESFAYTLLDAYAQFDGIIEISVKGNPALQLGDIIWVDTSKVAGQFKITKISNSISTRGVPQVIRAERYTPRHWFVLDQSLLDSTEVLAP